MSAEITNTTIDGAESPPAYSTLPSAAAPALPSTEVGLLASEASGKLLQTNEVIVLTPQYDAEPVVDNAFGDEPLRIGFILKVLSIKLLQSLGVGGIMYWFLKASLDFLVGFIVVATLAHCTTLALLAWSSEARRRSPYTYMFLVAHPLTFAIFVGAVTNGFVLRGIFTAWLYLCVSLLGLLMYAVFSLHTAHKPTAGMCVCIVAVTHTVLYASLVIFSYQDPFVALGFTLLTVLEGVYISNELALMTNSFAERPRDILTAEDYVQGAVNLHIDYYYFIAKILIPKCKIN